MKRVQSGLRRRHMEIMPLNLKEKLLCELCEVKVCRVNMPLHQSSLKHRTNKARLENKQEIPAPIPKVKWIPKTERMFCTFCNVWLCKQYYPRHQTSNVHRMYQAKVENRKMT